MVSSQNMGQLSYFHVVSVVVAVGVVALVAVHQQPLQERIRMDPYPFLDNQEEMMHLQLVSLGRDVSKRAPWKPEEPLTEDPLPEPPTPLPSPCWWGEPRWPPLETTLLLRCDGTVVVGYLFC